MSETTVLDQAALDQIFTRIRRYTEELCKPLTPDDFLLQVAAFVSPPKWHLAHTTWFFEEFILKRFLGNYSSYHPEFNFLFNSYYNGLGARINRNARRLITRPALSQVFDYRKVVDEHLLQLWRKDPGDELESLITLGLQHEQQHQELLVTDLKYSLAGNPLFPVYSENLSLVDTENPESGMLKVDEGIYKVGFSGSGFHYDNETACHKVYLHPFQIARGLVTNGEFIQFIEEGGYQKADLWLDDGWTWVKENQIQCPLYWHRDQSGWLQFTLMGKKPLISEHQLAHVNFYEASAFAEWSGMRLPTEFEWEVAAKDLKWGSRWEWTGSAYLPYPGYQKPDGAVGEYNGKFMVNQMVLRGSSSATSPNHSRITYRNFFHPHHRWQCTGLRLASKRQL